MLTADQIALAQGALVNGGYLTDVAQQQLLMFIRNLDRYRQFPGLYPGLQAKLAGAFGLTAQILQAALTAIEAKGSGQETIADKDSGLKWSRPDNRNEFLMDALNALYDVPVNRPTSAVVHMRSNICTVHSRPLSACGCRGAILI